MSLASYILTGACCSITFQPFIHYPTRIPLPYAVGKTSLTECQFLLESEHIQILVQ